MNQEFPTIHKILSFLLLFFSFQINKIVLVAIKLSIFILCPLIQLGVLLLLKPINARIYSDSSIKSCDNPNSESNQTSSQEPKTRRKKQRRPKLKRGITGSGSLTSSGSAEVVASHLNVNNNEVNGDCCSDNESASEGTDDGEEGDEMQEVRNLLPKMSFFVVI